MPAEAHAAPAAVLWDMDGTLVDSEKVWTVSLAETARALGGELSLQARESVVGSDLANTVVVLLADLGIPHDTDLAARVASSITARTRELFAGGLEWRPGAQDALRTVRNAGWPTALVTNTARELTDLALTGIGRGNFDVTVCGDEVPRGKPNPDPYLRAAALLGVDAVMCLAVEDSPTGALAAERAGAAVLVVPCDVAVPDGPGRVQRVSLVGLTPDDIRSVYEDVASGRALR